MCVAGSHVIKTLTFSVTVTKRDVARKRRSDRFPSVGDCKNVILTFGLAWAGPKHTGIGELVKNVRVCIDF